MSDAQKVIKYVAISLAVLLIVTIISSLVYLSILFVVYISKERVNSLENKIFKAIMVSNIIGLVIELGCFITVTNMYKIPTINSIVTKLLLVYYLIVFLLVL